MRFLTTDQKNMLRGEGLKANILADFYLDSGTYRFCDDVEDLTDGGAYTWIGANALFGSTDIRAGSPLTAEQVTITLDGTRMFQAGLADPAAVLNSLFSEAFHQRRVDLSFAFAQLDSQLIQLIVPAYSGKINNARLVDDGIDSITETSAAFSKLEIVLDSWAARLKRKSFRTRSNDDQLQLDPNDKFFSFVSGAVGTEETLYWGKESPKTNVAATSSYDKSKIHPLVHFLT